MPSAEIHLKGKTLIIKEDPQESRIYFTYKNRV